MKTIREVLTESASMNPKDFGTICTKILKDVKHLSLQSDNIFMQPIPSGMIVHVKKGINADKIRKALEGNNYWTVSDYSDTSTLFPVAFVLTVS